MGRPKTRWIFFLSLILVLTAFSLVRNLDAQKGKFVGTQTCIDCHSTWLDNNPPDADVVAGNASTDYPPLNLLNHRDGNPPFYTIPEGWVHSIHNVPAFDLTQTDEVPCEACHGSGQAHFGVGAIPTPIPNIKTCEGCHNSSHGFDSKAFDKTAHANPNRKPGKFFDQLTFGPVQAKIANSTPPAPLTSAPVGTLLFKSGTFGPLGDPVTRSNRIEECSVCHQYALQYPQFRGKIDEGNLPPKPEVTCGACHDAHIVAPDGLEPAIATTTVAVTAITGTSTVVSVSAVPGRQVEYLNHKPYRLNDKGAQEVRVGQDGIWTRGSAINRPQTILIQGNCAVATSSDGTCDLITLSCVNCPGTQGFVTNQVMAGDTLFISGVASTTVNLPSDAKLAGQPITVQATLDRATFQVIQVIDNRTVLVGASVLFSTTVTYIKADGKTTGTLAVPVSFCGLSLNFEVRDMFSNTVDLCGACHTRGDYKYTMWGKKPDGTLADLSATHNTDVRAQYNTSGHADRTATPWVEFFTYGAMNINYPYDMSITGSGGVGSLRNKGKTTFTLISTPDSTLAYLSAKGNTNLPSTTGSFACLQCHNGLTSIDYQTDVQGTSAASVVWGDATLVCITCHDPHANDAGPDSNIRKPVKLSYNTTYFADAANPRGGLNKFLDGTDIPSATENGIVCLFCHQGRESGLTVYLNITRNTTVNPYTSPDVRLTGINSFQDPHFLESGALLWSRNTWEYLTVSGAPTPNKYNSGIGPHQDQNCMGCHMGEASPNGLEGGHTWRPRIEVCQQCHPGVQSFQDIQASADWDGDGKVDSAFAEIGTVNDSVAGTVDSGLYGQLDTALRAKGIYYNPNTRPYFFTGPDFKTSFSNWTTNTLTAAFNLGFLYSAGNCVYIHNPFYAAQILLDSIKALGVTSPGYKNRPAGDRSATDYRTIVLP